MVVHELRLLAVRTGSEEVWRGEGGVEYTSLAEEGAGFISRTRLVESICRHFMAWVNRWDDDGFKPLHDLWVQRLQVAAKWRCLTGLSRTGSALTRTARR